MCIVSNVIDAAGKWNWPTEWQLPKRPSEQEEVKRMIQDLKEQVRAARLLDHTLRQPDCEDPEKAKLLDKVAKLEAELKALKQPRDKYGRFVRRT